MPPFAETRWRPRFSSGVKTIVPSSAPAPAGWEPRVAERDHGTAGQRHFLELAVRKEGDPARIGRDEGLDRPFRARERDGLEAVQGAHEEL